MHSTEPTSLATPPTTPSSSSAQVLIRMCPSWASKYPQLMALRWVWSVSVAVPSSVVVCLRELRAAQSSADRPLWGRGLSEAQSSADSRPWASPCRAAPCSADSRRSRNPKVVRFWAVTHLYRRCPREAPVWTVTPCTAGTPPQMRDTGTCRDRAAPRATRDHPLPPSPSRLQATRMGG